MAFSAALRRAASAAALRRAASAAAPPAIRALCGTRRTHHSALLLRSPPLRAALSREPLGPRTALPRSSVISHFSSLAQKPDSDADLLDVIDSEIKCAEECDDHDRVEEMPSGFPFNVQDEKGTNIITLTRTFRDEKIEAVVSMPSLVTGEEPERGRDADDDDGEGSEKPATSSLPLTVNFTKGDGPALEFTCTAYPDVVVIDSMSVRENKDSNEEMIAYEGPDFNDLDENLQKAFQKYLEIRGIKPMHTNCLHEYMINKDSREYMFWLKNLKQFIQK